MIEIAQATLQRLDDVKGGPKDKDMVRKSGDQIKVQFNPTSLKLERRNNVSKGGATVKTTKRTTPSSEPATLTFDLEFDTAEEGGADQPADVRIKTAQIRQFVEQPPGSGKPPPRVQFQWGSFTFNGIMDRVSEDLDYFAANGTPLRAKLSVTISEQDLQFEGNEKGPGARDAATATDPGGSPTRTGPGTSGTRTPDRAVVAKEGESAADVLTGLGLDPSAWRALMNNLDNPLDLGAGAQVELGVEVEGAGGIGVSAGFAAGAEFSAGAELSAALGVSGSFGAGVSAGFSAGVSAGASIGGSFDTSLGGAFDAAASGSFDAFASGSFGGSFGGSVGGSFTASIAGSVDGGFAGGQPGTQAAASAGFLLAAGGGIERSLTVVQAGQTGAAVARARSSFATPAPESEPAAPLGDTGSRPPSQPPAGLPQPPPRAAAASPAAAPPPPIDRRALAYGRAIPLRARANAPTLAESEAGGRRSVAARARPQEAPTADRARSAPWAQLPPIAAGRTAADERQRRRDAPTRTMRWRPGGECS